MVTKFRFYIIAVFIGLAGILILLFRFLRRRGVAVTVLQETLFIVGVLLIVDTLIVSRLSNFNLGVILPAFFGAPLVAMCFLLPHLTTGFGLYFKWFVAGCYALAAVLLTVCGILMLSAQKDARNVEADAVIVLGAAVHGDRVTWILGNRLDAAYEYLLAHPKAIAVVSGGQGAGESVTEGSAMKKYLIERGIDPARVFAEEKATNTGENFAFSKKIVDETLGTDATVAFVTTGFHVFRAGRVARAQGIDAAGIPAEDVWYIAINNFLRESVGICVYALRGQL